MSAQVDKRLPITTITESGGAGSGTWTITAAQADVSDDATDCKVSQVTITVTQGAGRSYPTWLFKVGNKLSVGLELNN